MLVLRPRPAPETLSAGTSFIPHFGQLDASVSVTSGCIGQTYEVGADWSGISFIPHFGQLDASVSVTSGCIGQTYWAASSVSSP